MRIKHDLSTEALITNMEEIKSIINKEVALSQMERLTKLLATCDAVISILEEQQKNDEPERKRFNWFKIG